MDEPAADDKKSEETAPLKLIRFFDMGVAPWEEVQYRMRVWLADPNDPKPEVFERVSTDDSGNAEEDAAAAPTATANTGLGAATGQRGGKGGGAGAQPGAKTGSGTYDLTNLDVAPAVRKRLSDREKEPAPEGKTAFLKHCLPSEWSEPTAWIQVPRANAEVVAGRIDTGLPQTVRDVTYYVEEPQVNVVVKKWDPALQVQVPVPQKVYRGSVMNFRSEAMVLNPIDRQVYPVKRELIEGGKDDNGVKFSTNSFVVDMFGGGKMPFSTLEKTYFEPSEVLVMREDGKLVVRDELDDRTEFRHGTYAEDEALTDTVAVAKEAEEEKADANKNEAPSRRGRNR
jgi:hypothetical protein